MKNILVILIIIFSFSAVAQKVEKVWETPKAFKVPESVLYTDTVIYVSNVNGKPTEKNGKGFISKLSTDGKIVKLNWVTGINAPKGMGIYESKLYVTNIDNIVVIELKTGLIISRLKIPESKFLNDISISESGVVAVSDMYTSTIHFIKNGRLFKSLKDEKLNYVNGLYWDGDILYAGTAGTIYMINTNDYKLIKLIEDTGGIDGLIKLNDSSFIITDWSGKMQLVSTDNPPIELLNTTDTGVNAADIGFDKVNNIIFIPTFSHNTVAAYKLVE